MSHTRPPGAQDAKMATDPLLDELDGAISALLHIGDAAGASAEDQRAAGKHRRALERLSARLRDAIQTTALFGPVGVGKSSLLAQLAGLTVGTPPTNPAELRERAILPIGSGKTTAFAVMVRGPAPDERMDRIGLRLAPLPLEALRGVVDGVADLELLLRQDAASAGEDGRPDPAGEELRRVVLNMCGYPERLEVQFEGNLKRTRRIRPLDEVISRFDSRDALREHLLSRMNFAERTQIEWDFSDDAADLAALKALLDRINQGLEPNAPLPRQIELLVPALASRDDGPLALLDTRGLDGALRARADLLELLRHPDAVFVLCSSFTNAPSPELVELLRLIGRDRSLWTVRDRLLLLIIDKGEAEGVVGAEGSREMGQVIRAEECWRALVAQGLSEGLAQDRVLAFDPLADPPSAPMARIRGLHAEARNRLRSAAAEALEDSRALREGDAHDRAMQEQIDAQITRVLRVVRPDGQPMDDPMLGFTEALRECPYALRIRAALRVQGEFRNLNLLDAVEQTAREAATVWLAALWHSLWERLEDLDAPPAVLGRSLRQLADAFDQTVQEYGRAVREDVGRHLHNASVWQEALDEWGRGRGFRDRVVERFERWAALQPFSAHRATALATHLPQLARLQAPEESPALTLRAENLRRLRRMRWRIQGVNLLIGANGAGKTTLLSALRFFASAYANGADSAASQVLLAQSNLRTWGVDDREPVLLELELGETQWRFELRPLSEQRAIDIRERLTHRGEEVFSVSELRRITYRGHDLGHVGQGSGLAYLMRMNKVDVPLTSVAALAERLRSYRVPNLHLLKEGGTRPLPERALEPAAGNAFAVLYRMKDAPKELHKYAFVLDGLKLAFPGLVEDLAFNLTETTVEVYVLPPGDRPPNYIAQEADGVLQLLVNLVAVASAQPGEIIALDQPDDHLHPYAARAFLRRVERWAHMHKLTVVLATHSVVLLDEMKGSPEHVFVMSPNTDGVVPNALTDLYNSDWLASFELGELYKNDELGSNADEA